MIAKVDLSKKMTFSTLEVINEVLMAVNFNRDLNREDLVIELNKGHFKDCRFVLYANFIEVKLNGKTILILE